ncbi:MAG: helix-turn-helix transcriptional regulator [Clostridia bacterium]|nr:helix-turn-helix transcriptional regulator [Clostridia bacterium]
MDILGKIKELQGERKWTDYKLAQEADIPLATLSSLFQRNNPPKFDTLQCICNAFGLTLAQFFLEDEKIEVLSEVEKAMLQEFRKLSIKQQLALLAVFTE